VRQAPFFHLATSSVCGTHVSYDGGAHGVEKYVSATKISLNFNVRSRLIRPGSSHSRGLSLALNSAQPTPRRTLARNKKFRRPPLPGQEIAPRPHFAHPARRSPIRPTGPTSGRLTTTHCATRNPHRRTCTRLSGCRTLFPSKRVRSEIINSSHLILVSSTPARRLLLQLPVLRLRLHVHRHIRIPPTRGTGFRACAHSSSTGVRVEPFQPIVIAIHGARS
jgi:hypothetical protein